jgi:hypothetical protein
MRGTYPRRLALGCACALVLAATACEDPFWSPREPGPAELWIGETGLVLSEHDTVRLSYWVREFRRSAPRQSPRGLRPIWSTSDSYVANVDAEGTLTTGRPGRAIVTVELGAKKDTATIVVYGSGGPPHEQTYRSVHVGDSFACALAAGASRTAGAGTTPASSAAV